jgi:hypothetical protein
MSARPPQCGQVIGSMRGFTGKTDFFTGIV